MVENAIDEFAVRGEAGIVDIVDAVAGDRVASPIGAPAIPARAAKALDAPISAASG
jgi:hypothetical protein